MSSFKQRTFAFEAGMQKKFALLHEYCCFLFDEALLRDLRAMLVFS